MMRFHRTHLRSVSAATLIATAALAVVGMVAATPISVYPVRNGEFALTLNGDWSFKYLAGKDAGGDAAFFKPDFGVSSWKKIPVPANWELHGFSEPRYALELDEGLGLYRRDFTVPEKWNGRKVCVRFEGVAYGFEAWINGSKVGESSASAYNPHTFDITSTLRPDGNNMLAVKVVTKPLGWEFDVNDDWALSGIFRDVTLFSVPETHLRDISTQTKIEDDGSVEFAVGISLSPKDGRVAGKLIAPDGTVAGEFHRDYGTDGHYQFHVKVEHPLLWTAETPFLYQLQLTLSSKEEILQTVTERVGLREISTSEGVLKLNGRPIKLRGVNHHDIAPETGRSVTEAEMRRDLELMKKGNINFIRTSHYPPQPRFIALCDEMGFYVMDEVPIGKGEQHLNDPAYRENILARVEPTITRDRNHASVIIWSIGNENPVTDAELAACRRAKEIDPSRPICTPKIGSYFAQNADKIPEYVDIYSPHYPGNTALRRYARTLKRPVILTEYAHALGLATDRIQEQWQILQETPTYAGGAIWHFHDQGLLWKSEQPVNAGKSTDSVWLDKNRYYDTHGNDGCDGIVYADRTPQTDFWEIRKVYAPVRIAERSATVKPGAQEIPLTVENRHDFRSLAGMKLAWSLRRNGAPFQQGELPLHAASRESEHIRVPVKIPNDAAGDILTLDARCVDEAGLQINERTIRLDLAEFKRDAWLAELPGGGESKVHESEKELKIEHPRWLLAVDRSSGGLKISDRSGRVLVEGIYPHSGRALTMAEERSAGRGNTWRDSMLTAANHVEVRVAGRDSMINIKVSATYPRPQPAKEKEIRRSDEPLDQADKEVVQREVKDESFTGGYEMEVSPSGTISLRYEYVPTHAHGKFSEAGLSVVLPAGMSEFRWIGQGPYAGYPGKDLLNEFGLFHLNRGDLNYQGNRRGTEIALVTTPQGAGVALVTDPSDMAIERDGDRTLLSHNAVISGLGNKGGSPETLVDAEKTKSISGSFTLVPLDDVWPAALTRWFGEPAAAQEVFRPFYHSYDQ